MTALNISSWGFTLALLACAAPLKERPASPRTTDAVLVSRRNLFAFEFPKAKYSKWPRDAVRPAIDTLPPSAWLAIPPPGGPFSPMRALPGPGGDFFLLDRAGKRLCLYDTNAQFLSCFPLPQEIRERNLNPFQVFWTRDGVFSFVNPSEGRVWQFAETQNYSGSGDWRLRGRIDLPLGLGSCVWEPFSRNPCCVKGKGSLCFDAYFNPTGPWRNAKGAAEGNTEVSEEPRAELSPTEPEWILIFPARPGETASCFFPGQGAFSTCPAP